MNKVAEVRDEFGLSLHNKRKFMIITKTQIMIVVVYNYLGTNFNEINNNKNKMRIEKARRTQLLHQT